MNLLLIMNEERQLPKRTFACRELSVFVGRKVITALLDTNKSVVKMDKLEHVTEVVISLDKLDNTDNLEDGRLCNVLLRYHVTANGEFTSFEPVTPQYRRLKNGEFASLTLRIMDQKNNIITDGQEMTIVLHIRSDP